MPWRSINAALHWRSGNDSFLPFSIIRIDVGIHRLSVHIFVSLIVLLALGMFLINLVFIQYSQRMLFKDKMAEGTLLLAAISQLLDNDHPLRTTDPALKNALTGLQKKSGFLSVLVISATSGERCFIKHPHFSEKRLLRLTQQAIQSGKEIHQLSGSALGIFWEQQKELIISAPLFQSQEIIGGISIALDLEDKYQDLRQMQKLVIVYSIINAFILALIGLLRLSKITINPLRKLVQSAETFNENSGIFLFNEKEGNEFSQLSRALNQMLSRISKNKAELKSTVDALRRANAELKKAQNEIINAEKLASIGRLSAGIAHEIGNPIAIILGYFELLKRGDITAEERDDFIARTEKEIHRINTIIRHLLEISKPSTENARKISVHELLAELMDVFSFQPSMSIIRLKTRLSAENDAVYADPSQLRQVFLNLIMNAVDAIHSNDQGESGGKITISTRHREASADRPPILEIAFHDNGPGIPQENLVRVFDPFYTTKAPGKGTGLGLSVCFMIIEAMQGKIKAFSPGGGEGTTMIVQLPSVNGATDVL